MTVNPHELTALRLKLLALTGAQLTAREACLLRAGLRLLPPDPWVHDPATPARNLKTWRHRAPEQPRLKRFLSWG